MSGNICAGKQLQPSEKQGNVNLQYLPSGSTIQVGLFVSSAVDPCQCSALSPPVFII